MKMKNNKSPLPIGMLLLVLIITSCSRLVPIPPTPAPKDLVIKSPHGRYVIAQNEDERWALTQKPGFTECGWFNVQYLSNGKVALESCHGRYVTAPGDVESKEEWILVQEAGLKECGQFDMYELGEDRVAFKTCAGNFWTAGNVDWPAGLKWSVVADTDYMDQWEILVVQEKPDKPLPLPLIADFDTCDDDGRMTPQASPDNSMTASYVGQR